LETDATRMCALLVGLPDVVVVGVAEWPNWLRVLIEVPSLRPECGCGGRVHRHGVRKVELVDLSIFGRPARLVWRKQRWRCTGCGRCWSDDNGDIATSRCVLTTRAARWSTPQVGRHGRAVTEVAGDLGCGWHTVMDAVVVVGEQLIDHPFRIGEVSALGLDETLFARGPVPSPVVVDPDRRRAPRPGSSTSWRFGTPPSHAAGSPDVTRRAAIRSSGPRSTSLRATAPCSTPCSRQRPRSPIRSTSCSSPTEHSTSADAEFRPRRWATGVGETIRSTEPGDDSRSLVSGCRSINTTGSWVCCELVIPARRCSSRGTRKRSCARSTTTPTPSSRSSGSTRSAVTSPIARCPWRSVGSGSRSPDGRPRSALGTGHTSRTGRPKR
jgi:transposase-like protein